MNVMNTPNKPPKSREQIMRERNILLALLLVGFVLLTFGVSIVNISR